MSENRLGRETSPYLLQHRDNPVHWWAWGPEALAEARRAGKPILLSVGYAACHWCHVMAHESFEDAATAAVMNELFINIKVDREERPDIDAIYMGALHRLGQQGGWPLTMFLDSGARPFWGGTYFPKEGRWGRPAFTDVLRQISRVYHEEPEKVASNADALTASLAEVTRPGSFQVTDPLRHSLVTRMAGAVDRVHGGITGAPKFPQWTFFWLLWRGAIRYDDRAARAAVETTLLHVAQGGIYDHLRGGFARYSVDERWLVPHFEKMLYDNALLVDLLTDVWRETRNPLFRARVAETIGWIEAEMIADGGGFAASLDADSEGEEGKFYVWSKAEIDRLLDAETAAVFAEVYDVSADGNWEGKTILNRLEALELRDEATEAKLAAARATLLAARAARVRPGWDDKVLADWNGLAIAAIARASLVFRRPEWLAAAERAFAFVTREMSVDGRLVHSYRERRGTAAATASDYANMIWGALRLYQATARQAYLDQALAWTEILDRDYWVDEIGGYATTATGAGDVIVRLRTAHDDATPSANTVMVSNLAQLALLTGDLRFHERGVEILRAFAGDMAQNLAGHAGLIAAAVDLDAPQLIVISGRELPGATTLLDTLHAVSLPGAAELAVQSADIQAGSPVLAGKTPVGGRAAAYVCLGPQCSAPVQQPVALGNLLRIRRLQDGYG